jgi:tetratricopeptide (TPR) repeat protein
MRNHFSEFNSLFNYKQQYTQDLKRFKQILKDSDNLLELGNKCQEAAHYWEKKALSLVLDSAEDYFDKGKYLYRNNHYEESIIAFNCALDINPQYIECLRYKAYALMGLDRTQEAEIIMQLPKIKNYHKSLDERLSQEQAKLNLANPCYVNPGDARTYNEKGVALFYSENYEEAFACFKEAIKLKRTYIDAYFNIKKIYNMIRTKCYLRMNKYCDIAIQLLPKILTEDNDLYVTTYFNKAEALCRLRHYAEAILYYDRCIEVKSNYAAAYVGKIYALVYLGYKEKAIETQNHALSHNLALKLDVELEDYLREIKVNNTGSSDQNSKKIFDCICNECKKKNKNPSLDSVKNLLEGSITHFTVTKSLFESNNPWCFFSAGYLLHLSLELFLKSCIQHYNQKFKRIHCLKGLTNDLSLLRTVKLKHSTLKHIEEINKFYEQRYEPQPIRSNEHQNWYNVVLDILFSISDDEFYKIFLNMYFQNMSYYGHFSVY